MATTLQNELAETKELRELISFHEWSWPKKILLTAVWTLISFAFLSLVISIPWATSTLERQKAEGDARLQRALDEQKQKLVASQRAQLIVYGKQIETLKKQLLLAADPVKQVPGVLEINTKLEAKTVLSRRAAIGGQPFIDLPNDNYRILGSAACCKGETTLAIARDDLTGNWFFVSIDGRYDNPPPKKLTVVQGAKVKLGF